MINRLSTLFTRQPTATDRRVAALLDDTIEGASTPLPTTTPEERALLGTAQVLRATLAGKPVPMGARERVWQDAQARAVQAGRSSQGRSWPVAPGRPLLLAGVAALLLAVLPVLLTQPWAGEPALPNPVAALVQSAAAAAPPSVPVGQVLHCAGTQAHAQPDRAPWSGRRDVWSDPQRRLIRAEIAGGPKSSREAPIDVRQVFDGGEAWRYQPGVGLLREEATTYEQLAEQYPCALGDDMGALRAALARRESGTTVAVDEERLDGVPVTVLTIRVAAGDKTLARLAFDTRGADPSPAFVGLPVRYTFDGAGRLVRKESWLLGLDSAGRGVVIGPKEDRLDYTLAPAEQYPADFFGPDAIAQP